MPSTIFEDNFNSYVDGDLNGQGGWTAPGVYDIQGVIVKEGAKAVQCSSTTTEDIAKKTGTATGGDGRITVYIRVNVTNSVANFILLDNAENQIMSVFFHTDGYIKWYYGSLYYSAIQAYNANQWYCIEIEWKASDKKYRVRIDGGTWTDWQPCMYNRDPTTANKVWLDVRGDVKPITAYFDYIAEYPYVPPVGRSYGYIF
jgi:hypothetical protein